MKIRPIFFLIAVLACSSIAFSLLGRLESTISLISMAMLAVLDFAAILYFFRGQRYAQILSSTRVIDVVFRIVIVVSCIVGALLA